MAQMDVEALARIVDRYVTNRAVHLSAGERVEVLRIAQGLACKQSANLAGVSYETVRARRKRIYRKLSVDGASEVISSLLGFSLGIMARDAQQQRRNGVASDPASAASVAFEMTQPSP